MLPFSETDAQILFNIYMKHIIEISHHSYEVNFMDFIQECKNTQPSLSRNISIHYFYEIQDAFHNIIQNLPSRIGNDNELNEIYIIVKRYYEEYMKTYPEMF
jgi:hypothetical protein